MGRLTGEARDRVRASSLTLVGAIVLLALVLLLYGGLVGYDRTLTVPAAVVEVSEDGRALAVELSLDRCQHDLRVEVVEEPEVVVLTSRVTDRRPYFRDCGEPAPVLEEVTLVDPLGTRAVVHRTTPR